MPSSAGYSAKEEREEKTQSSDVGDMSIFHGWLGRLSLVSCHT